jgi:hypothetical protein
MCDCRSSNVVYGVAIIMAVAVLAPGNNIAQKAQPGLS